MARTKHLTAQERWKYLRVENVNLELTAHVQSCEKCQKAITAMRKGRVSILEDVFPMVGFPAKNDDEVN